MGKNFIKSILCIALIISLCGCQMPGNQGSNKTYANEITIDVFDSQANFQGIQAGWFGQLVKDKFNMELNIIAPNRTYNGETLLASRAASGSIGDIIMFSADNGQLSKLASQGLLYDMSEDLEGSPLMEKYGEAVRSLNEGLGLDGIYAIPSAVSTLSPLTSRSTLDPTYSPYIRWDLYGEIGYPQIDTLEDLLGVLKSMQEAYPQTEEGEPVYGFSFFAEWDDNMMNAAKQPCCFYGYDEWGFVLAKADGSDYQNILDENSLYMRVLKFFYDANQMGLVDPDSRKQNYSEVFKKYENGQVLYSPWPFQGKSAFNTEANLQDGKGFMIVDIGDMLIYDYGCTPNGSAENVIAVGNDASDKERMVDFIEFLYSDEGVYTNQATQNDGSAGPMGICWELKDGKPYLTDYGVETFFGKEKTPFPNGEYEGNFRDGVSQLNYVAVLLKQEDEYGNPYSYWLWDSEKLRDKSDIEIEWMNYMDATDTLDYLEKNGKIIVAPGVLYAATTEESEISEIRQACKKIVTEYSWKMVFAKDITEFESYKNEMINNCKSLGYDKVYEYDLENAKAEGKLKQDYIK